jgi:hypothetical protein
MSLRNASATARPRREEIESLALPPRGGHVQTIARTYYAAGVAVETADIVFPASRYEQVYRIPVD